MDSVIDVAGVGSCCLGGVRDSVLMAVAVVTSRGARISGERVLVGPREWRTRLRRWGEVAGRWLSEVRGRFGRVIVVAGVLARLVGSLLMRTLGSLSVASVGIAVVVIVGVAIDSFGVVAAVGVVVAVFEVDFDADFSFSGAARSTAVVLLVAVVVAVTSIARTSTGAAATGFFRENIAVHIVSACCLSGEIGRAHV